MFTAGWIPLPSQLVMPWSCFMTAARVRSGPTALAACSKARPADQAKMPKMSWW